MGIDWTAIAQAVPTFVWDYLSRFAAVFGASGFLAMLAVIFTDKSKRRTNNIALFFCVFLGFVLLMLVFSILQNLSEIK